MTRYHNVKQLTTAELERARRELQANLGLITAGSPAHVPIQAHMQAIDAELAGRVKSPARAGLDTARAGPEKAMRITE
jgi:hypothetical protein